MKFNTNQLIVIMAIIFAAIIGVHIFAPTAAATVVSLGTALFTTLYLGHEKAQEPKE